MSKLLILCVLVSFSISSVISRTIEVCGACNYTKISEAIEIASDSDTIIIKKGVYKESNLFIKGKSIHIIGEKGSIIDAEQKKESIFIVSADNVSIQRLTMRNVGFSYTKEYGTVHIIGSNNFLIKNNRFEDVFYALLVHNSKKGSLEGNVVVGKPDTQANSGNGFHLWKTDSLNIKNNYVSGMRDGIYIEFGKNAEISCNTCENNLRYGLHFMFSDNNAYLKNTFENNGAGVAVMFSDNITMIKNTFKNNWGAASYGLLLKEIKDSEIKGNTFEENTIGINADGLSRVDFKKNDFSKNGYALKILGACYDNHYHDNNFLYNSFDVGYSGRINNNEFKNNYWTNYNGYDLDRDGFGDVPHRPVRLFSYIVNKSPESIILLRSLFIDLLEYSEKVSPVFTPDNLLDESPRMKKR